MVPKNELRSLTRRRSTRDAGRNPLRPISIMRPPLTTSITSPSTVSPLWNFSSTLFQALLYSARFLERRSLPSLSSFCITKASTSSPSETSSDVSTSSRIESSRAGITPSDLNPMSSKTSSCSIFTIVPVTSSPSSMSVIVPSIRLSISSLETSSSWKIDLFLISVKMDPSQKNFGAPLVIVISDSADACPWDDQASMKLHCLRGPILFFCLFYRHRHSINAKAGRNKT